MRLKVRGFSAAGGRRLSFPVQGLPYREDRYPAQEEKRWVCVLGAVRQGRAACRLCLAMEEEAGFRSAFFTSTRGWGSSGTMEGRESFFPAEKSFWESVAPVRDFSCGQARGQAAWTWSFWLHRRCGQGRGREEARHTGGWLAVKECSFSPALLPSGRNGRCFSTEGAKRHFLRQRKSGRQEKRRGHVFSVSARLPVCKRRVSFPAGCRTGPLFQQKGNAGFGVRHAIFSLPGGMVVLGQERGVPPLSCHGGG